MLAAAVTLELVALILFLTADGVGTLLAARVVRGIATGAAITTLSAAVVDFAPPQARVRAGVVMSVATLLGLAGGSVGAAYLASACPPCSPGWPRASSACARQRWCTAGSSSRWASWRW